MLALSIRQPFAGLLLSGHKPAEYRSWRTAYRGPLLIHASAKPPTRDHWTYTDGVPPDVLALCEPLGALIGQLDLTGCLTPREWNRRRRGQIYTGFAWTFGRHAEVFDPVPCSGRLGLWPVPAELLALTGA